MAMLYAISMIDALKEHMVLGLSQGFFLKAYEGEDQSGHNAAEGHAGLVEDSGQGVDYAGDAASMPSSSEPPGTWTMSKDSIRKPTR